MAASLAQSFETPSEPVAGSLLQDITRRLAAMTYFFYHPRGAHAQRWPAHAQRWPAHIYERLARQAGAGRAGLGI